MKDGQENVFEPLPLRRRELVPVSPNQYRITTAAGEIRQLEALTAYEAFILSGFKAAVKIERISNMERSLVDKNEFIDDGEFNPTEAFADVTQALAESPEAILLHRNPILTAEQLSTLMKSLTQEEPPAPAESVATVAEPPEAVVELPVAAPMPAAPPPAFAEGIVPGPTGMDVHGDGFDEIIPQEMPVKPQAAIRHPEPLPASSAEPAPALPPARELTEAEVEKLLGGK